MPEHNEFDERLAQRLRAYESRIPDGEIPTTDARPARSTRSPLAAGAVIAVGALVGVVLALVLLNRPAAPTGEASASPSASSQATPSAEVSLAPSVSAGPSASGAPSDEEFTTIILGDGGTASVATSGPAGAVALGYDGSGPLAWFSPDGREWSSAQVPAGLEDMRPTAVVASDQGYVAAMVACVEGSECFGGELWYSADGTSWADTPTSLTGGVLVHLAAGGPGFVAMAIEPFASGSPGVTPTVLVSADGQTWDAGQPPSLSGANVHALTGAGGEVVAIGSQGLEAGALDATWTTTDGLTWERTDEDSDRAAVYDMAWNGDEFLAVGQGSCPEFGLGPQCPGETSLAWRSPDGRTWQPALVDACCGGLSDVTATGTGWVATVTPGEEPNDAPRALAGTPDGAEWRAVDFEVDADLVVESVAFHDGVVLFVGELRQGDRPQPVVIVFNAQLP